MDSLWLVCRYVDFTVDNQGACNLFESQRPYQRYLSRKALRSCGLRCSSLHIIINIIILNIIINITCIEGKTGSTNQTVTKQSRVPAVPWSSREVEVVFCEANIAVSVLVLDTDGVTLIIEKLPLPSIVIKGGDDACLLPEVLKATAGSQGVRLGTRELSHQDLPLLVLLVGQPDGDLD